MNNNFTNEELRDMHYYYGMARGNALAAQRMYRRAFPNRVIPQHRMFSNIHRRLGELGRFKVNRTDAGRPRTTRSAAAELRILTAIENDPSTSVRIIAAEENVPKTCVHEILREQQLYPYHYQKVQALAPADPETRLNFCHRIGDIYHENQTFLSRVLFTDEAGFGHDGLINLHNDHFWADENPKKHVEHSFQNKFSLNVWAGIIGDHLIGPHFFPRRLTGEVYLHFLRNDLPVLLEEVPLQVRNSMWLLQDGAPPHFSVAVREYLNEIFPNRWIGREGFVPWPPRSPDLNPMDFFFWGYLKTLVYKDSVNNVEELRQRIINCCEIIRRKWGLFARVRRSFLRRLQLCIEMEGHQFENIL